MYAIGSLDQNPFPSITCQHPTGRNQEPESWLLLL
jgi:hypothetical protein